LGRYVIVTLRLEPGTSKMPVEIVERQIRQLFNSEILSKSFHVEKVSVLEETVELEA